MAVETCSSFAELSKKLTARADDLKDIVRKMRKKDIVVGIPPESTYPNGKKIVDVAELIEYGTHAMAPRPFMRIAAAANKDKWNRKLVDGIRQELREHKKRNLRPILISVAEEMQKDIKKTMLDLDIYDTGRMHSSISILKAR